MFSQFSPPAQGQALCISHPGLCCSCWFRLLLPLAGSQLAVTLTLILQNCSVLHDHPPLSHAYNLRPDCIHTICFYFQYFTVVTFFTTISFMFLFLYKDSSSGRAANIHISLLFILTGLIGVL